MWSYQDGLGWLLATGMLVTALSHAPHGMIGRLPAIDWRQATQQIEEAFEHAIPCGEDPGICVEPYGSVR
jgi:hypothetical protein